MTNPHRQGPPAHLTERGRVLDRYVPTITFTPPEEVVPEVQVSTVQATVDRWVDGDSVDVLIRLDFVGLDAVATPRVRLYGVDAPERGQEGFYAAKDRANELAPTGSVVTLRSLTLANKTGQFVAEVFFGGVNIGETLVSEKLAQHYTRKRDSR
ncbi:MAG: thermonuclease family protein [Actinobacteria bacterium]|nr:thermonuclease family protein [Actinomycetota bacterium]MCA1807199.1 thermonuclease family protein [Actinomycetota bacterium]